jgi:hypothetical protein
MELAILCKGIPGQEFHYERPALITLIVYVVFAEVEMSVPVNVSIPVLKASSSLGRISRTEVKHLSA